jgi:hypothetical protein
LTWPPPGLERIPGQLSTLIAVLALGDLLLVLPLIASVATDQHFLSFGAFGSSWWVPIVSTAVGVIILAGGFERLVRLLWSAAKAAQAGHGWRLVLHVVADVDRDSGFLIQGMRHYEGVSPSQRKLILEMKLVGVLALAGAVVWAPFGFSLAVMMASAGWVGAGAIWVLGVVLPALAVVVGVGARFASGLLARSVRKGRRVDATALEGEIASWNDTLAGAATAEGFDAGGRRQHRVFRLLAVGMALVGVMAVIPPVALTTSGGIAPLISSIAIPKFSRTQAKLATADVFRDYAAPVDSTVTPQAAGEALHALAMAGVRDRDSLLQPAVRTYAPPWTDSSYARVLPRVGTQAALDLLARARGGLTREERRALRGVASHPMQEEVGTIARADVVDVVGTRWTIPFPEEMPKWALPITRFTPLKYSGAMHLALAAQELSEGRPANAERAVREVISLGFVLIDDAPLLIDNLIGVILVRSGGEGLLTLYRATGRSAEADRLEEVLAAVVATAERVSAVPSGTAGGMLRVIPAMVTDTTLTPGLRWELYGMVTAFAGCLNLHTLVFGAGEEYETWRTEARAALVRLPSEEQLFELFGRSVFGTEGCGTLFDQLRLLRMVY